MNRSSLKKKKWDLVRTKAKKREKNKYWWISIIYFFIPVVLILFFDKVIYESLLNRVSYVDLGNGAKLMNSSYAINNVFGPFCRSVVLIIAVLLVFIILLHINKKLINKGIIFKNAKVILNIVEVFILAFTIIIAVYGKVDNFDYTKYGIQVQDIESALEEGNIENIALREVPSIHSIRRNTSEDTVGYKVISELSEWAYFLSDNFELFIALAAAVIVPFKKYTEKINI